MEGLPSKNVTILYGSQTGNAEDVAERTGRQLTRLGCKVRLYNLKDYPIFNLASETLVVFVCSTTGNGEVPDDMKNSWRFLLKKNLPTDFLNRLKFAIFGLGDSSYDKYNVTAKKLNKRIQQLGATELVSLALADDQHELGYDAAYELWIQSLKAKVRDIYNLHDCFIPDDQLLPPRFKIQFLDKNLLQLHSPVSSPTNVFGVVKENSRMTSDDHFQSVHLIKFAKNQLYHIKHDPGDVAVLWPENPQEEIEEFLSLLSVPLDQEFVLNLSDESTFLPEIYPYPYTARNCAKFYFDFMSVPKRSFFEFFSQFSKDETEKEKLIEFNTGEGQEELFNYCNRPKRTILEVMLDFPHTTPHVPFEYLFDMIPQIHPRKFSIASASVAYPDEFHLAVAVVNYRTRLKKPRRGLCSNWLAKLPVGTEVPYYIVRGSIQLPKNENPIIMVGPGTGCAPFRAFIQHRIHEGIKENYLFFGCRNQEKDFLFESDWKEYVASGYLTIYTAFSRDQEEKCYVQHKISENGELLVNLLTTKGAYIYVAGNAKQMPDDVKAAFVDVLEKSGKETGYGLKYMQYLIDSKRYHQETWA